MKDDSKIEKACKRFISDCQQARVRVLVFLDLEDTAQVFIPSLKDGAMVPYASLYQVGKNKPEQATVIAGVILSGLLDSKDGSSTLAKIPYDLQLKILAALLGEFPDHAEHPKEQTPDLACPGQTEAE